MIFPTNVAKATFSLLLLLVFFVGSFKKLNSQIYLSVLLGYRLKKDEVERCNMKYVKLTSMSNTNQFNYLMGFHMEQQNTFFAFPSLLYNMSRILIIKFHYLFSTYNILVKKLEPYLIIAFSLST